MKSFKIKDLVVSIDTESRIVDQTICFHPSMVCYWPTICPIFTCGGCSVLACSHLPSYVTGTIVIWKTTTPVQVHVDNIAETELVEFKTQLAELQKYVDAKIQGAPEKLDQLEGKLKEAIEEVRAQKNNLKKGK
jgi:hypothetical protein